jgi:hypothetical protein
VSAEERKNKKVFFSQSFCHTGSGIMITIKKSGNTVEIQSQRENLLSVIMPEIRNRKVKSDIKVCPKRFVLLHFCSNHCSFKLDTTKQLSRYVCMSVCVLIM